MTDPLEFRRRVTSVVVAGIAELKDVTACFEGGSAATGRLDAYSDIDLVVVAPLAVADQIFEAIERSVLKVAAIEHEWRADPPPFREVTQRLYLLAGSPQFFMLDCVVANIDGVAPFLERDRHGEPLVYFDRGTERIAARPLDQRAHRARRGQRLAQLHGAVPIYERLVAKELARGRPLEAFGFYQALIRALIELLGMRERPDRFDFGWRYIESELSVASQKCIAEFAFVAEPRDLENRNLALGRELRALLAASS